MLISVDITSVSTYSSTTVLPPVTITKPSATVHPTVTSTPKAITSTKTITLLTLTIIKPTLSITQVTNTATASCVTPTKVFSADPTATITPTVVTAAALQSTAAEAKFRRHQARRNLDIRKQQLEARAKRFAGKRAPGMKTGSNFRICCLTISTDFPQITLTETDTAKYITSTSTSIAPTKTVTVICKYCHLLMSVRKLSLLMYAAVTTQPVTSTPPAVTTYDGVSSASAQTVTLPTTTKFKTNYVVGLF